MSPLFNSLVDVSEDTSRQLTGMVAYSLYKKAKCEWVDSLGHTPTSQEIEAYHKSWTATQVEAVTSTAEGALAAFGESVVESATPDILRSALKGSFVRDLGVGVLSAFLYSVLLIVFVIVLRWQDVDVLSLLEKAKPPPKAANSQQRK